MNIQYEFPQVRIGPDLDLGLHVQYSCHVSKGQLISELIYEVIVSPEIRTKNYQDFCPHYTGQKS